jgi:hypothetical protein
VNESYEILQPVEASADGTRLDPWHGKSLTLGGEINKLASNIALARDAAGVHFRSDSINGLKLGEAVGIGLLADYTRTYSERFDGFVLTGFDGQKVRVSRGYVERG